MPTTTQLPQHTDTVANNILAPFIQSCREYFEGGRYCYRRRYRYMIAISHFGAWLHREGYAAVEINETVSGRFLSEHLPRCACPGPIRRDIIGNRAALNHLIRILRAQGVLGQPIDDEVTRELAIFDTKMADIWGLSKGTRDHRCRIIRRLLTSKFGSGPIDLASIRPSVIRGFVLGETGWSPNTIRVMGGAVRCYLRHRKLLGDEIADLLRAVPRPAYWHQTSLPEVLSGDELEQLYRAFDASCPSRRRGYAMVRCLADLGLRCSEVVKLRLEDIDWQAGSIRIAAGKARRADVMPLPAATGEAIADYLWHERPQTERREIFVRRVAPVGEPVGRRAVQRTLHAAYRRLGWSRTRVHVLRHTLATRLINAGTPIKQIADVLRHRSIVTSANYTRVDATRLSAVALPWPGSVA